MKFKEENYSDLYCFNTYHITTINPNSYSNANWLKTDFNDIYWICDFEKNNKITIEFNIMLGKHLLTDNINKEFLNTIKCWLCMQTHPSITNGIVLSPVVAMRRICHTLNLIDYFILNSKRLMIDKHGLKGICANDIKELFISLATSSEIAFSIYDWSNKLTEYLRNNIINLLPEQIEFCIKSWPSIIDNIPARDEWMLGLTEMEIVQSRIWLKINNFYNRSCNDEYSFSIKTVTLSKIIYKDSLRGFTPKPIPIELCFEPVERFMKEFTQVPVRVNEEDRLSEKKFSKYYNLLNNILILDKYNMSVPSIALESLSYIEIKQNLNLKDTDRFRTLPNDVAFTSLRFSIEFFLDFGDDLATSYIRLVKLAQHHNMTCLQYANQFGITNLLTPNLRHLGVDRWTIDYSYNCLKVNGDRITKCDYFILLRSNVGLWELIRVLYGSIIICLGTLMARRVRELSGLKSGSCLDKSERYLLFHNQKSGPAGNNELISRPFPSIATKMIRLLENIHHNLIALNLLSENHPIFCHPSQKGLTLVNYTKINRHLDYFCDYFEVKLDELGRRYYIRQHQLRRFFAMFFFWCNSYGGIDTLRWFLGHTDIEHVYHYITESTPGDVLRNVKAQYAIEKLVSNEAEDSLSNFILSHFGVNNFKILNIIELEYYIESLIDSNILIVEPVFFATPEGKNYKVVVKLSIE